MRPILCRNGGTERTGNLLAKEVSSKGIFQWSDNLDVLSSHRMKFLFDPCVGGAVEGQRVAVD